MLATARRPWYIVSRGGTIVEEENDATESLNEEPPHSGFSEHRFQIILALIGAGATIAAAVIAGAMAWFPGRSEPVAPPVPMPTAPITLSVEIDGPDEAPLNEATYFTIISEEASRVEWAIAGFGEDTINPFSQTEQIFVEPIDAGRVGEWFTLVVTAYDADGESAGARHRFRLAPPGE